MSCEAHIFPEKVTAGLTEIGIEPCIILRLDGSRVWLSTEQAHGLYAELSVVLQSLEAKSGSDDKR